MANSDRPRGLEPQGQVLRQNSYTAGADVKVGDAVAKQADGKVDPVATGGSSYTSFVLGVAMNNAADGEEVIVSDHPDQQYKIQADGADIAAQTNIGLNYAILATNASSQFEISRMELDSSTGNVTATLPLKLQRIDKGEGNVLGAQVDCIVRINNNQLVSTGTLGV